MSHKIKRTTGVRIVCSPHRLFSYAPHQWGSDQYWAWCERQATEWCSEFHAFMRDHRSRDPVNMDVERDTEEVCSQCGALWEEIDIDGRQCCSNCGDAVDAKETHNG
jgi:hypothetical protein